MGVRLPPLLRHGQDRVHLQRRADVIAIRNGKTALSLPVDRRCGCVSKTLLMKCLSRDDSSILQSTTFPAGRTASICSYTPPHLSIKKPPFDADMPASFEWQTCARIQGNTAFWIAAVPIFRGMHFYFVRTSHTSRTSSVFRKERKKETHALRRLYAVADSFTGATLAPMHAYPCLSSLPFCRCLRHHSTMCR